MADVQTPAQIEAVSPRTPAAMPMPTDFKDIAAQLTKTREQGAAMERGASERAEQKRSEVEQAYERQQREMAPLLDETQTAIKASTERALGLLKKPPTIPEPPTKGMNAFLMPVAGEPPQQTITKLMQGLGLIAGMIGGGRDGARASLSALTGALKGAREGDKDRFDREYKVWQAQTDKLMNQWQMERQSYEDVLKAEGLELTNRMRLLELTALNHGNEMKAKLAGADNADKFLADLRASNKSAEDFQLKVAEFQKSVELARERNAMTKELRESENQLKYLLARNTILHQRQMEDFKAQELKLKEKEAAQMNSSVDNAMLDDLAEQWRQGAQLSELVRGLGKQATHMAMEIQRRAIAKSIEGGDQPGAIALARNARKANAAALADLTKREAQYNSFVISFEKTVTNALSLNDAAKRGGIPIFNKWANRGRSQFKGDPDIKVWEDQLEILASEAARVTSRSNAPTETQRQEMRKIFSSAQTEEQFRQSVDKVLRRDAAYGRQGFAEEKEALIRSLQQTGPLLPAGPTAEPAAPAETFKLSDGTSVTVTR